MRAARIAAFALVAMLPRAASAQAADLRLEDAVRLALTRNERARIAELNVDVAEAAVEKARAAFLPALTLNANDTQRPYTTERNGVVSQPANIGTGNVTLNQPLVNLPAWPLYSQSKELRDAQLSQTVDDKRQLAFDTAKAFFSVLNAQAVLKAAERRLDSAKANLADTQARVQAALTSSNDATRAEIDVVSAGREVEVDRGGVATAELALAYVINAPVSGELATPDLLLEASAKNPGVPDDLVKLAAAHRPDLLAKRHTASAAHDAADEPLLRLAPTLNLTGQVSATTNSGTSGRWNDEYVGVNLTWVLFDAGTRYADKHSRDASAEIADLNVQALVRTVDNQVRAAVVSLAAAQATYEMSKQAVDAARRSADETAILYRQGLAKAIELVDANDQRFVAEVNAATAEYAMAQAYLALRQALGLDPLGTELK
jgi:outer membrane protein TolC